MKIDYREMLNEVRELTTIEGFVSACYELKENMMFYDRDLVLAAYGSTVEFWLVATLFCAALELEEGFSEVEKDLEDSLEHLTRQLMTESLPLDVQFLAGHFVKGSGWVMLQRYPVYVEMVRSYANDKQLDESTLDRLLQQVNQMISMKKWDKVLKLMGQVGAKVLLGERIRPIWFQIGDMRLQMWLSGLQTLISNYSVAPYFTYPFDNIWSERQKRTRVNGNVVVDLAAFRNFRQEAGGYTDQRISIASDQHDQLLAEVLDADSLDLTLVAQEEVKETIEPILLAVIEAFATKRDISVQHTKRAFEVLVHYESSHVTAVALKILDGIDPWDEMFQFCLNQIEALDQKALPEIRKYIRKHAFGPLHLALADLLGYSRSSKRVAALLKELFDMAEWGAGKEAVGRSLYRYLGAEAALVLLNDALRDQPEQDRDRYLDYIQNKGLHPFGVV